MYFYNNTALYHHGIKGQKWGVRRFQNEDGSLTTEGEKHRSNIQNTNKESIKYLMKRNIHDAKNNMRSSNSDAFEMEKKILNNKDLKEMLKETGKIYKEVLSAEDKYTSKDSQEYKDAYKKFFKTHDENNDNDYYYFDHYYWSPLAEGGPEYKKAVQKGREEAKALNKQLKEHTKLLTNLLIDKNRTDETYVKAGERLVDDLASTAIWYYDK